MVDLRMQGFINPELASAHGGQAATDKDQELKYGAVFNITIYRHLGVADGVSIARAWACRCSKRPPLRGGRFEYRRAHTRAMDMASAMPRCI